MVLKVGDRVRLIKPYWVYHAGDCDNDPNVAALKVGEAVGTLHLLESGRENIVEVTWDPSRRLRVNLACLEEEVPVSEEDLNDALR
jgi:hypothetical protein